MASKLKASQVLVIDGEGQIAGRLSSHVAKMLLDNHQVYVVNAEKILISGKRGMVFREWLKRLEISSAVHPKHGPFHPRTPDGILTRIVRGMIPRRKPKGIKALKRLRVYVNTPPHLELVTKKIFDDAKISKPQSFYVSLGEVATSLGWRSASA